jgi:hypothetical protein
MGLKEELAALYEKDFYEWTQRNSELLSQAVSTKQTPPMQRFHRPSGKSSGSAGFMRKGCGVSATG